MAYSVTWNAAFEALPADSEAVSDGASRIRALKVALQERMAKDHYFPNNGTDADMGEHVAITLRETSKPSAVANKGFLYTKDVGGSTELFYLDNSGNEVQLTGGGGTVDPGTLIPSGTKMLFYQDTAPSGWTIINTLDDKLAFITKGSAAGGKTGGAVHSTGTWALSGLNTGAVTLTAAQSGLPAHTHAIASGVSGYAGGSLIMRGINSETALATGAVTGGAASASASHAHTIAAADTWRPAAYCFIICSKDA